MEIDFQDHYMRLFGAGDIVVSSEMKRFIVVGVDDDSQSVSVKTCKDTRDIRTTILFKEHELN